MAPWLLTGLGFFKSQWKILLICGTALFVAWQGKSLIKGYFEDQRMDEREKLVLISERHDARVEAESAKAALAEVEKQRDFLKTLYEEALVKQDLIRVEAREQQEIFERHNLQKLTDAKPGLIEKLSNRATQERMDAFEDAFNN